MTESTEPQPPPDPHSSLRLEISLSVGYQRRRATLGGAWESGITTVLLLIGGILIVLLFLIWVAGLKLP